MRLLLLVFVSLFFIACSSSQKITKTPPAPVSATGEYKIGIGDDLSILVWKSSEFTSSALVRPDGKISLALLGDVNALGKSTERLAKDITKLLSTYMRKPQVTVAVLSSGSSEYLSRVRITGAVATPISIPHRKGMTVLDLVLQSGGLNEYAKGNRAKLFRTVDGQVDVYSININDILNDGNLATNYILAPSDILTVPQRLF